MITSLILSRSARRVPGRCNQIHAWKDPAYSPRRGELPLAGFRLLHSAGDPTERGVNLIAGGRLSVDFALSSK